MSDPEAIFPFWLLMQRKPPGSYGSRSPGRAWCPGPASSVVQVTAAVWGRDQSASTTQWDRNDLSQPEILLSQFCQSCKRGWKQNIAEARGVPELVRYFTSLIHRSATTERQHSVMWGLFWFYVVNSFLLLVFAHCVVLKRPIILECTKSVHVLDKQIMLWLCLLRGSILPPAAYLQSQLFSSEERARNPEAYQAGIKSGHIGRFFLTLIS